MAQLKQISISDLKKHIIACVSEKKAIDIREYDVQKHTWLTDYVMVIGVSNVIHCKAMVTALIDIFGLLSETERDQLEINHINQSGTTDSGWVILDLGPLVIHCIDSQSRTFYKLDDLLEKQGTVYHY